MTRVQAIEDAVHRALERRGTVMLASPHSDRYWCAVCAAVDGSLELRVGEPGSAWRRRERREGERWLRDHGFVHVTDAWTKPVASGASSRSCAVTLDQALTEALGMPPDRLVVEVLFHPGVLAGAARTPAEAPIAEHIKSAVIALAAYGRGKLAIDGGRPASTLAWVFAIDGQLIVSPEAFEGGSDQEWAVPLVLDQASAAADRLVSFLVRQRGGKWGPLFISFMPLRPEDPPLL